MAMAGRRRPVSDSRRPEMVLSVDEYQLSNLMDLLSIMSLVGPPVNEGSDPTFKEVSLSEINPFTNASISPKRLLAIWKSYLDDEISPGVTDLLFIEFWASIGYYSVNLALQDNGSRFKYTNTLIAIRKRVGYRLYEYARDLNWQQPVTYVSALKVARAYLRDGCGHSEARNWNDYGHFTGKLGVATVLIAGFEQVLPEDANEAYQAIRRSLDAGNDPVSALPYLVDAAAISFDFTRDIAKLKEAVSWALKYGSPGDSSALQLSIAQAQLRIALQTQDRRVLNDVVCFVDKAVESSDIKVIEFLQIQILRGVVSHLQFKWPPGTDASGLRIPFGYRTGDETHPLLLASAREVFKEIRQSDRIQDPMVAGLLADLVVNCRSTLGITEEQALVASVKYRKSGGSEPQSKFVGFHDELNLASLRQDEDGRLRAVQELGKLAKDSRYTASTQMVLAANIETWGPLASAVDSPTHAELKDNRSPDLTRLCMTGTSRDLWRLVAKSALENANLTKMNLGGRSSVTTVGDYYGLIAETLVFKRMDKRSWERGNSRSAAIGQYLQDNGWAEEYAVSTALDATGSGDSILVAHRFVAGTPLMKVFESGDSPQRLKLATLAARFLGLINRIEMRSASDDGVRKDLKGKEIGRFLKSCGLQDYLDTFNCWWDVVKDVDKVSRRDSHLDNWLRDDNGRIVAIDLEATGCRPIGYDLAQITDDHAFFEVEDWTSRRVIFDAYLGQIEPKASLENCWRSYKAGVLARHLWAITSPERAKLFSPGEAEKRLQTFVQTVGDDELAKVAQVALDAALKKRGLKGLPPASKNTTGAGRIRLSKRIAYQLRQNMSLERDKVGWVRIADLAKELQGPSLEEIATVATDPREVRFEVEGEFIRARYGHNSKLEHPISFDAEIPGSASLYHASPWKFAFEILDKGIGLCAQNRSMVHLTNSFVEAVASGIRKGHPLIYETRTSSLKAVMKAGEQTYLTPQVYSSALMVVPVSTYWKELPPVGTWIS